jgi:hypothetical protein
VAPGNSNSEGNWVEVIADASVTFNVYEVWVGVYGTNATGVDRQYLLDVGADTSGGTSYVAFAENLLCGKSVTLTASQNAHFAGVWYRLPMYFPSGTAFAARLQCNQTTDTGVEVVDMRIFGGQSNFATVKGTFCEVVGGITDSSSNSTVAAGSGVAETFTAYTDLGTVSKDVWHVQLGYQAHSSAMAGDRTYMQLAYGDATNKYVVCHDWFNTSTAEVIAANVRMPRYHAIPAGSNLYVRSKVDSASVIVYGVQAVCVGG